MNSEGCVMCGAPLPTECGRMFCDNCKQKWGFSDDADERQAPRRVIQHEAKEQEAVFDWAERMQTRYPDLALLFHVPNGGKRDRREAAHLKRQGVKPGVPDIWFPVPCGGYHGLVIEMKFGDNTTTPKQEQWLKALHRHGWAVKVAYTWLEAVGAIEKYIMLKAEEDHGER